MCCGPSGVGSGPAVRFATIPEPDTSQTVPALAAGFASATYTLPSGGPETNADGKSPRVTFAVTVEPERTDRLELSKLAT